MIPLKRRDQKSDNGKRRRDHAEDQIAREPLSCRPDLLAQRVAVRQNAPGPFNDAFAFGGQAAKTAAALYDQHVELGFKLADGGRQGGLGHATRRGSATKMGFPRKRHQILEMTQNHAAQLPARNPWLRKVPRRCRRIR
jgi:hypothetical protein